MNELWLNMRTVWTKSVDEVIARRQKKKPKPFFREEVLQLAPKRKARLTKKLSVNFSLPIYTSLSNTQARQTRRISEFEKRNTRRDKKN